MIDVHAHIQSINFPEESLSKMVDLAREAGVTQIVSVSESVFDALDVLNVARTSNGLIWPGLGLHPVQPLSKEDNQPRSVTLKDLEEFEPILQQSISAKEICCIGEIGLDFSLHILAKNTHNPSTLSEDELKNIQRQVFKRQVEMAIDADLTVNVHSRSAGHHALAILYECNAKRVIMHAFDGKVSYAKKAVEAGYYFSVPPSIVRSPEKQNLVAALPLSHLLLESDSPALGPQKNVDNTPANILLAAMEIARIKKVDVEQVIKTTTDNAIKLLIKPY
ncbi:putative deoxyribonuclease TATDN3-like protein [Phycomyces blakesleeanus]|uniref:Deoxyribonuclease TATDN3-like protein n=1 Tax=Phycomyces blakesleeanus TaxID=4837 RepID=A0ABR3AMU0_PHYBL